MKMTRRNIHMCRFFAIFSICLLCADSAVSADKLRFNQDIRPILSENCFACHGFDSKHREANLRLDTADGAYGEKDGTFPLKPGDLEQSEVWRRIISEDDDELMPPPKSHKKLTQAQKETIKQWIEQGAEYQKHWAFEAPVLPKANAENAIDGFLAERQSKEGLAFAKEAEKETLIRRVAFTLTGLPPTLTEVDAYSNDPSPQAYEAMVDRYMKSARYGEEMARHWLDVARYADTHGLHLDNERSMWAYRDWVVKAFNSNLSFDEFTIWQVAGDLLPKATPDQTTATGFSRCNVTTSEGGAIDEEYRHLYAVDRASTLTTAWMGLTGGCAQCHDHKYDPLSTKEFYSLYAFFYSGADPAMDKNSASTEPFLKLATPTQKKALDLVIKAEANALKALEVATKDVSYIDPKEMDTAPDAQTLTQIIFDDAFPVGAEIKNTSRNPSVWESKPDFGAPSGHRVLKQSSAQFLEDAITLTLTPLNLPESPRISIWARTDTLNTPRVLSIVLNGNRVFWGQEDALDGSSFGAMKKVVHAGPLPKPGVWTLLSFDPTQFDLKAGTRVASISVQQVGGTVAWDLCSITGEVKASDDLFASFSHWWKAVSTGKKNPPDVPSPILKTLTTAPDQVTDDKKREALLRFYLARIAYPASDEIEKRRLIWEDAKVDRAAADFAIPGSMVFRDLDKPRDTFIAMRGAYNKLGDPIEPAVPAVMPVLKKADPAARATRLDLAKWLVSSENPTTARVTVNRFWQQIFGIGLVKTSHDFGSQGEPPSHPELLDYLAVTFREGGWNVKALIKQLVMSQAFRQASQVEPRLLTLDHDNRLLARGPRIRLDAEQIRDNVLFVSGLIDLEMGGRGVRSYQPPNIWEPVGYGDSNTRYYLQDHGAALYRRSLYNFLKRTAPPPFMSNFDAPNREQSCPRRERSNTPMQALQLMNDVQHFEAARALAERAIKEGGKNDATKLSWLFRTVLSRKPDAKEAEMLHSALSKQRELFGAEPDAAQKAIQSGESKPKVVASATETASWTLIANLILNLDETVNRN